MGDTKTPDSLRTLLETTRTVAVVGAHHEPRRAAFYVPSYLSRVGYRVIAVNPEFAGRVWWGEPVRARVSDIGERVDLVNVFRRPDAMPDHLDEILAMRPRPRAVWLQLGIRHEEVARKLVDAGIEVVQDRCTYADHRRLGVKRVA